MSEIDLDAIKARVEKAHAHIGDICTRKARWKMTIPADPDRDSDLILSAALNDVDVLLAEVKRARADSRAAGFAEAVAMLRDDNRYTNWWTALPQRSPDYGYWRGPGRRHLADYLETIKLPLPAASRPPAAEGSGTPEEEIK